MADDAGGKVGGWVDAAIDDIDVVVGAGVTTGASQSDIDCYLALKSRPRGQRATQGAHELDPIKRLWDWSRSKLETIKITQSMAAASASASPSSSGSKK